MKDMHPPPPTHTHAEDPFSEVACHAEKQRGNHTGCLPSYKSGGESTVCIQSPLRIGNCVIVALLHSDNIEHWQD